MADLLLTADIDTTGLAGLRRLLRDSGANRGTGPFMGNLDRLRGYAKLVQVVRKAGITDPITPENLMDLLERAGG